MLYNNIILAKCPVRRFDGHKFISAVILIFKLKVYKNKAKARSCLTALYGFCADFLSKISIIIVDERSGYKKCSTLYTAVQARENHMR